MPTLHTYSTPTKPQPTLPLHTFTTVTTYTTPTTPTTQHTLCSTLRIGPAPAHMLNEHVVDQQDCYLLVIEYYVLRHILVILLCLKMFRVSCRRKEYWIPPKTCNSGRLHNHYWITRQWVYTLENVGFLRLDSPIRKGTALSFVLFHWDHVFNFCRCLFRQQFPAACLIKLSLLPQRVYTTVFVKRDNTALDCWFL